MKDTRASLCALALVASWRGASTFCPTPTRHHHRRLSYTSSDRSNSPANFFAQTSKDSWSVADDWNSLSSLNPANTIPDSKDIFHQDLAWRAAYEMSKNEKTSEMSKEDKWTQDIIDHIQEPEDIEEVKDTENFPIDQFEEEMGKEISMLVRCNQSPESLLVTEGRALSRLTTQERDNPLQLVAIREGKWQPTPFLITATETMFEMHSTRDGNDDSIMTAAGVADWMTTSLGGTSDEKVGMFDRRVTSTLARYGQYGNGYLRLEDFRKLYMRTLVGKRGISPEFFLRTDPSRYLSHRQDLIDAVWRDIRAHGILSPIEQQYSARMEQIVHSTLQISLDNATDNLFDECLIEQESYIAQGISQTTDREGIASHEMVELASDRKTPVWMKDGEFVFIDEESCIGCMQCTSAAPSTFRIVENGRARTFAQRNSPDVAIAVSTCPVDCMHYVSFDELKELEGARDHGDGREDHRHFGSTSKGYVGRIPLYVSGMDSDANHRSSWYHYLKNKCQVSSQCPQRGCYDCKRYSEPGANPHFQARLREANHVRAQHFIATGVAAAYRKTAEL